MVKPTDTDPGLNGVESSKSKKNTELENAVTDYSLKLRADSQLVKLPQFMPSDPNMWFDLIEIIFDAEKITEQKLKYANVIMAMEPELILEMEQIFKSTKTDCSFDILKSKILERYKNLKEYDTKMKLSKEKLGDRAPSEFLEHLLIAGNILPEKDLRSILIGCLPEDVQEALEKLVEIEDNNMVTLEKLAKQADVLLDFYLKSLSKNYNKGFF